MVLYHASTMYHLLCCIVHRLAFNSNEDAHLLLLEYIKPQKERESFYKKLCDFGFFSDVRYVPEQQFKLKKGIALNENSTKKQINTVINNISNAFENWFSSDVKNYSNFYVASDQHSFGIYLMKNKIPYIYMEDASGMLSEQDRYLSITKSNNLTNHIINEYLGGAGRNECVKAKLCDLAHQKKGFYDEKAVDFSIYQTLKNIIPQHIPTLLKFFGNINTTIKSDKNICLFLTQDLNTLKIKDLDLQELMMTTIVDYVCPDHTLVIKPHPKDRWQNYRRIFPSAQILQRGVPSELLPFTIDGDIDIALTASSTSIRGVTEFAKHSYSFTTEIEVHRERLDSMYIAVELLKELKIFSSVKVQNINEIQINCLLDNAGIKTEGNTILIDGGIKTPSQIEYDNYDLVLCLNLGNVLNYCSSENTDNTFMIDAHFIPQSDSLINEKHYSIFAHCSNEKLITQLNSIKFFRKLKNTKSKINVTCHKITKEISEKLNAKLRQDMEWKEKENE